MCSATPTGTTTEALILAKGMQTFEWILSEKQTDSLLRETGEGQELIALRRDEATELMMYGTL